MPALPLSASPLSVSAWFVCFVLLCMPFETRSSTELKARSIHLRMLSDKDWFPKLRTNLLIIRQTLTLFGVHRPNAVRTPALAWDPGPFIKIHLIVRPSSDVRWQNSGCQSIQDALTMVSAPLDTFALLLQGMRYCTCHVSTMTTVFYTPVREHTVRDM